MSSALTVARKELRALFQSPVALLFQGTFLLVSLVGVFSWSRFFARGLADVRPLFELLPLLLIFLVSAVTMRAWAEERKAGTLEVLLTLPVRTVDLVLGKFLAGLGLVAISLAWTTPLPIAVWMMGPLDWGPVLGGYLGALLLSSSYLALGLCVSARTDNQVVALMSTLALGGGLYLLGHPHVTGFFDESTAEVLRALGSGSRFASIERGVLDFRDLAYYLGLTSFFLVLNGYFLVQPRLDPGSAGGGARARQLHLLLALVAGNAALANLWLHPVAALRLDLTANGDFSISQATTDTLRRLDEPLEIKGYFTARTHELLAPLIPQVKDLLTEYAVRGGDKVNVEFLDPSVDEALETEIGEAYGIRSFPFGVSDRNSQAVVNAYFHILVKYGDKYEVLSFQDLIEVQADDRDLKVVLRNFEYDMTRTIKKVSQDFQSLDVVLASLPGEAKITAYITPATLPEEFQSSAEAMRTVGEEFAKKGRGKVIFSEVDPSASPGLDQKLFDDYGLRPLAADLLGTETFYLHLLIEAGGNADRILPRGELTEADLRKALEAAIKRATPGQLKTVAVLTEIPEAPPPNPQIPPQFQPPPPQPDFRQVQNLLQEFYQVRPEALEEGFVPEDVDILLVAKTGALTEKQQYAIDQYLMRGGSVIALAGSYAIDLSQQGLQVKTLDRSLHQLLEHYGVKVVEGLLMDPQNAQFPMPRIERRGGFQLQRVELIPYPLLPDIRQDGFLTGHPALAGVNGVTLPWASPLEWVEDKLAKVERFELLRSSADSWVDTTGNIQPDLVTYPDYGFPIGAERARKLGAVALQGKFGSYFAGKRNPVYGNESGDASGRTLAESVVDGRLVVVGSSELISDLLLQMASQPTGAVHRGNLQLVQNLMDWTVEDTDLLSIRAGAAFTRTLNPMSEDVKFTWEMLIYAACLAPLALTALAQLGRSRRATPLPLPKEVA